MRRRYEKQGILALHPQAFFDMFMEVPEPPSNQTIGNCEVVIIRGPLDHHAGGWSDSYEAIVDRVAAACASSASTVVLRIDSIGGDLHGCFDASRAIRARCAAAGKRLVSYVEGCACSAGYALACAAEQIVTSETAFLGSIGIVIARVDITARDAAMGARYAFVASGSRKVDGNPHATLTEAEMTVLQAQCDAMAEVFYELVASLRPGATTESLRALEAGVFHGAAAVDKRLADEVMSFDALLERLAQGETMTRQTNTQNAATSSSTSTPATSSAPAPAAATSSAPAPAASAADIDEARAALERAAEGDDEDAARARRALEALDAGTDDDEEEAPSQEAAASTSARARPASVSASTAGDLAQTVTALSRSVARLEARNESLERSTFLASRPDLSKELVAVLNTKPLAECRAIVEAIPKPERPNPAASAVVGATRGQNQGGFTSGAPSAVSSDAARLDREMGLAPAAPPVRQDAHSMQFSAVAPRRAPTTTGGQPAAPAASAAKAG